MRANLFGSALHLVSSRRRGLPRKDTLLHGVIVDADGEVPSECVIRDMNVRGAAISHAETLPIGTQVYLLDIANRSVHLSRVIRSSGDRTGLMFVQSYTMGPGLPPRLKFLWRFLLEGNLRRVERAVAAGTHTGLALRSVGLTEAYLHQMARHASADRKLQGLLHRARRLLGV
jgi:hypothetical protein